MEDRRKGLWRIGEGAVEDRGRSCGGYDHRVGPGKSLSAFMQRPTGGPVSVGRGFQEEGNKVTLTQCDVGLVYQHDRN